jgi:hypothetical protein
MATDGNAENIAEDLTASIKSHLPAKRSSRSRSLSMGPNTGLAVPLKEDDGNRRKSAILPGVKSILSGKEDEDEARKRKEARRKSLGKCAIDLENYKDTILTCTQQTDAFHSHQKQRFTPGTSLNICAMLTQPSHPLPRPHTIH